MLCILCESEIVVPATIRAVVTRVLCAACGGGSVQYYDSNGNQVSAFQHGGVCGNSRGASAQDAFGNSSGFVQNNAGSIGWNQGPFGMRQMAYTPPVPQVMFQPPPVQVQVVHQPQPLFQQMDPSDENMLRLLAASQMGGLFF